MRDNLCIITGRSHDADPLQQAETTNSNNLQSKSLVTVSCFWRLNNHQQLSGFRHLITSSQVLLVSPGHMEVSFGFSVCSLHHTDKFHMHKVICNNILNMSLEAVLSNLDQIWRMFQRPVCVFYQTRRISLATAATPDPDEEKDGADVGAKFNF